MRRIQDSSISKKLTWMNMLVSGAALLLACSAFVAYDVVTFHAAEVSNLSTQAQMAASNSISALLFDDPDAAQNTLSALKTTPNIKYAGIYGLDGRPFASYRRDQGGQVPALPPIAQGETEAHRFEGNQVVLVRTIVSEGKPIGIVYIQSDSQMLNARLERYAGISAVVLAASLLAALMVSSMFGRSVAEPIVHLAGIARAVSRDKKYSVRATPSGSGGELTVLVDAFNDMLVQIQERDGALQKARDGLEQRVQERTAELEAAKKEVEEYSYSILQAKEDLERASKFKDQFLSTMSHELRTPLNAILGFSDLLPDERYGPLNERQRRYVAHIHTSGQHLLSLINDILDLSKIEAGHVELTFESVRVETAFAEVVDTLRPLADKKSQTLSQHAENGLNVRADATRFKQVLMNLVGNAIKFSPEGGDIELAACLIDGKVRVEVRDTGPGIPLEEQKRIFENFYRLRQSEKSTEGTGLGLAITQKLVELHGGELGLESQPGHGSRFYFSLPMAPAHRERPARETGSVSKTSGSPRILVIEDDPAAAQLIELQLISSGYEVIVCDQPHRAAEIAEGLQPSAITLDLLMKPTNGWEVLVRLKRDPRTASIPIIVITIADQPAMGTILGADEYLVKPVDKMDLLAAMERCLGARVVQPARSILVVEDDAAAREFITELLTAQGHTVTNAADGAQARAQVGTALPKLVILDLLLPEVSGFELLAEWRANPRTADLPVFVLTSKDLSREEETYLRAHAERLFHKQQPWQEALASEVRRAVSSGQMENA
jgi:signal transduction histidine kinase/DNA-binding response OmpR family regulator